MKVVVVGGGVVGLCTAHYLQRAGAEVTVVESRRVGAGASHGNAGWISPSLSGPLPAPGMTRVALASLADRDSPLHVAPGRVPRLAPWLWRFWRACALDRHLAGLRATARLAGGTMELFDGLVDDGVDFAMAADGLLFACLRGDKAAGVLDSLRPMADFGYHLPDSPLDGGELRRLEPALGPDVEAGFVVPGERAVVPHTLLAGLTASLRARGATVSEGVAVTGVRPGPAGPRVDTSAGPLAADHVVLAAGAWTTAMAGSLGVSIPMEAGKGYSLSVAPSVAPSHALYLVEAKVGATMMEGRLRLAGTMELSGVDEHLDRRRVDALERTARRFLEPWAPGSEGDRWCGMRPLTADGLPVIGPAPGAPGVYLATGHAMLGVTLGPATGRLVADHLVTGRRPDVLAPFAPERFAR